MRSITAGFHGSAQCALRELRPGEPDTREVVWRVRSLVAGTSAPFSTECLWTAGTSARRSRLTVSGLRARSRRAAHAVFLVSRDRVAVDVAVGVAGDAETARASLEDLFAPREGAQCSTAARMQNETRTHRYASFISIEIPFNSLRITRTQSVRNNAHTRLQPVKNDAHTRLHPNNRAIARIRPCALAPTLRTPPTRFSLDSPDRIGYKTRRGSRDQIVRRRQWHLCGGE